VKRPPDVSEMTHGQLKLEYASKCQYHGSNGVVALGYASRASHADLQSALLKYHAAANQGDWTTAEDALIEVTKIPQP
jgi:hypothetical protein